MNIVFPIFNDVTQLDFTGPVQILSRVPGATVHVVSDTLDPVATDSGFAILPTTTFEHCPQADLICVPGGFGTAAACQNDALLDFVQVQAREARWITSVCTGVFVLGKAGLVAGRNVTSHWGYTHLIGQMGAQHKPGRCVIDGNLVTGGGVTAGIDFALRLVAEIAGEETAKTIQLALEYDPAPPFDCGHPDRAPARLIEQLRARYKDAAKSIGDAL